MPLTGHVARAEANASCMASSARSKEPEIRISVAIIRPDSRRKIASAVPLISSIGRCGNSFLHGIFPLGNARQRTNLDAAIPTTAAGRNSGSVSDGFVQIFAIQDVIACQLLAGFGKGAVRNERLSILDTDGCGSAGTGQRFRTFEHTIRARVLNDSEVSIHDFLLLRRSSFSRIFPGINQQHVTHLILLRVWVKEARRMRVVLPKVVRGRYFTRT